MIGVQEGKMTISGRFLGVLLLVLIILGACNSTEEEPAVTTPDSEPTAVPELVATEEPTVTPEPTNTPDPTATPEPPTPVPTETPLPRETPALMETSVPQGTVKGCVYWTDGSKVEDAVLEINDENFLVNEGQDAPSGCYKIVLTAGKWWISSVHWNFGDCVKGCRSPQQQLIDVPPGGTIEIDLHPVPPN
jgi:hypothetical protein